ncbi:MAG: DegT/DnrJ/EryC1/StrS family aminotransferase [Armatimonadota bacterium]
MPAILGGKPAFETMVDVVGPVVPALETISDRLAEAMRTGRLTNNGTYVREFEAACREYLGVKHAIALSNGTLSLVLMLKGRGLTGRVIIPSFTYIATAHALEWAGVEPVFADIDPETYCITPTTVEAAMVEGVSAVVAVPVFGNPCDVTGLQEFADRHGLCLFYDSAHAFGSSIDGVQVGNFGEAESFSLHATKALPAGEGGLLTTNDDDFAEWLMAARVFGDYGDHDTRFAGINAKMPEFSALVALEGLKNYPRMLDERQTMAHVYRSVLADLPGLKFQSMPGNRVSTYQNFSIQIDSEEFGMDRNLLHDALAAENIMSRKYFWPAAHKHKAYSHIGVAVNALATTDRVSEEILCLPTHPAKAAEFTQRIAEAVVGIWERRAEIARHGVQAR